jgi:hypothetical protein
VAQTQLATGPGTSTLEKGIAESDGALIVIGSVQLEVDLGCGTIVDRSLFDGVIDFTDSFLLRIAPDGSCTWSVLAGDRVLSTPSALAMSQSTLAVSGYYYTFRGSGGSGVYDADSRLLVFDR